MLNEGEGTLTLMIAAMVMVKPQPIESAIGRTNAEAPAAKMYRKTGVSERERTQAHSC